MAFFRRSKALLAIAISSSISRDTRAASSNCLRRTARSSGVSSMGGWRAFASGSSGWEMFVQRRRAVMVAIVQSGSGGGGWRTEERKRGRVASESVRSSFDKPDYPSLSSSVMLRGGGQAHQLDVEPALHADEL